jgi:hypothetical protein
MYNFNFDIWKFGHSQCANSANGALASLDMSKNDIGGHPASNGTLGALGASLKCSSITNLDISSNHLKAKDMSAFVEHLKGNATLKSLVMADNGGAISGELRSSCAARGIRLGE